MQKYAVLCVSSLPRVASRRSESYRANHPATRLPLWNSRLVVHVACWLSRFAYPRLHIKKIDETLIHTDLTFQATRVEKGLGKSQTCWRRKLLLFEQAHDWW
jgi:hypothetical protein